jgi:hypothetical protein
MTKKEYRAIVKKLGGTISRFGIVDFPDTLRITTKREALDLLDVLIYADDDTEKGFGFTVNLNTPFEKLRDAIERGIK